jgi:hypothetical protein
MQVTDQGLKVTELAPGVSKDQDGRHWLQTGSVGPVERAAGTGRHAAACRFYWYSEIL